MARFTFTAGPVELTPPPHRSTVTPEGGGRPISERTTIDGRVIATRPARAGAQRLRVSGGSYALPSAQAAALRALAESGESFTLILTGYDLSGTFLNCAFDGPVSFPPITERFSGYDFTVYIPQQQGA